MMALRRSVHIGGAVQCQHRDVVQAVARRIVAKVNAAGQGILYRLLEQAGPVTQNAARQPEARANERYTPNSHHRLPAIIAPRNQSAPRIKCLATLLAWRAGAIHPNRE